MGDPSAARLDITTDVAPEAGLDVPPAQERCRIVALGASAGGLDAFERFFRAVDPGLGVAFVVVQHLSPEHESILPQLLSAFTDMPVAPVADGAAPLANHVYVIPPNATLFFRAGRLHLNALEPRASRQPISAFFTSLANELGADAVAVILSGSGSDGSAGLQAIRARGGLAIVQSPAEAQYDGMPRSAIATGDVEFVVSAADMPPLIARETQRRDAQPRVALPGGQGGDPVAGITECLRRHTGKDFGGFKRSTVRRRIQRRLTVLGMTSLTDYLARLEVDEAEANALASDLMIGVTRFFRDRSAFQVLEEAVVPPLLEFSGEQPVRVWVPGCATGEEAYSLTVELLGHARRLEGARAGLPRVQIFATDINEAALAKARLGRYPASIAGDVPAEWLERYFLPDEGGYVVSKEVRDCCIFSMHDVLRDPPFSRVDLISCRNLLIYFDPEVQSRLLPLFHYALRPSGFLFLGSSETVGDLSSIFEPVDKKHRLFQRRNEVAAQVRVPTVLHSADRLLHRPPPRRGADGAPAMVELLRSALSGLLEERRAALAVVDGRGNARYFAGPISRYLPTPAGAPTTNVVELATGDLRLEISAALQAAGAGGGPVRRELPSVAGGEAPATELVVRALSPAAPPLDQFVVLLGDARPALAPTVHAGGADERAHQLEGELRIATDRWQRAVQDLESVNEELRSANEELQTMNEELQSSNEELQLSQEELQSVNEELNTVNTELAMKVEEVNGLYADLQNLFQSTRIATVVVDRELCVTRFTPAATRLYPLAQPDVGRPLANLADPFIGASVLAQARAVLEDLAPRECILELADGGGWHLLRALPYLSLSKAVAGAVLTFVDVTELKRAEAALQAAQERERRRATELEAIMRSVPAAVFIARDAAATRTVGNDAAYRLLRTTTGQNPSLSSGRAGAFRVLRGGRELSADELPLERAAASGVEVRDCEQEVHFADGGHIHLLGQALPLLDAGGRPAGAVAAFMDVTAMKDVEDALRSSEARFRGSLETMLDAFAVFRPVKGSDGRAVDFELEYLNDPAQRILAARPAERKRLRELVPQGSPLIRILVEAVERGALVDRPELAGAGAPGDDRIYDLRASPLESGELAVSWRDVTERTRATCALREADRRKDEFLAVLGHELRNPLAALSTALSLDEQLGERPAPAARHADLMHRQVRALRRLVDDLLDVTRISRGKVRVERKPVDLARVAREELEIHKHGAGARIHLRLALPAGPLWVSGDGDRIAQIAGNLIHNACKFTEPGGAVEVTVGASDDRRPQLVVRDQGIGMAPETLAHLFEPFRQADHSMDRARGGLGLGLSLVKAFANLMGAEVGARSDGLGRGSEFHVRFLAASPPAPAAEPGGSARPSRRARILVVEDNRDVRESFVEYLSAHLGHEVAFAEDGESGVAKALQWQPELVFCDIGLPRLDGYGFARALRAAPSLREAVLVAMTGYGSEGDKVLASESGFDQHFTKPVDLDTLERFIDGLPRGKRGSPGASGTSPPPRADPRE